MINIALVNQSKKVTTAQTKIIAAALNVATRPFCANRRLAEVKVTPYSTTDLFPADAWPIYIVGKMPANAPADALGDHDYVDNKPVAWISTEWTMPDQPAGAPPISPFGTIVPAVAPFINADGTPNPGAAQVIVPGSLSEVISHELFEMLADPSVNRYHADGAGRMLLVEVCDITDNLRYVVTVVTGILRRKQPVVIQGWATESAYIAGGKPPYSYPPGLAGTFVIDASKGCYGEFVAAGAVTTVGLDRLGGQTITGRN